MNDRTCRKCVHWFSDYGECRQGISIIYKGRKRWPSTLHYESCANFQSRKPRKDDGKPV